MLRNPPLSSPAGMPLIFCEHCMFSIDTLLTSKHNADKMKASNPAGGCTMPKETVNRRVQFTKTALRDAMIELICEKPPTSITVKDILPALQGCGLAARRGRGLRDRVYPVPLQGAG